MQKETTSKLTTALLYEYTMIVAQIFPSIETATQFKTIFNIEFPNYQPRNKLKMEPQTIFETRATSCTSAGLLLALWWNLTSEKQNSAIMYVKTASSRSNSSAVEHVKVKLPTDTYYEIAASKDDEKNYIMQEAEKPSPYYRPYNNVATYAANRLNKYGMRVKDRAKLLSVNNPEKQHIMTLENRPQEYFAFLQYCFVQKLSENQVSA